MFRVEDRKQRRIFFLDVFFFKRFGFPAALLLSLFGALFAVSWGAAVSVGSAVRAAGERWGTVVCGSCFVGANRAVGAAVANTACSSRTCSFSASLFSLVTRKKSTPITQAAARHSAITAVISFSRL
ncbi:MAG: hypothetical protein ACLR07_04925 [Christensenellales bacterium]